MYGDLRLEGRRAARCARGAGARDLRRLVLEDASAGATDRLGAGNGPVVDRIVSEKQNDDMTSATLTQLIGRPFLAEVATRSTSSSRSDSIASAGRRSWRRRASARRRRELAAPRAEPMWVALGQGLDERDLYEEAAARGWPASRWRRDARATARDVHAALVQLPRPEDLREGGRRLAVAIRSGAPRRASPRGAPIT